MWQCRPWWDAAFCGISSGSTLFAQACLQIYTVNTMGFFFSLTHNITQGPSCHMWVPRSACALFTVWLGPLFPIYEISRNFMEQRWPWSNWMDVQSDLGINVRMRHNIALDKHKYLGPVVQSIVSLTSSLVAKMLSSTKYNTKFTGIFAEKNVSSFCKCKAKATHIFSAKILGHMPYSMIKVLTIH